MWKNTQLILSIASILLSLWLAFSAGFLEVNSFKSSKTPSDNSLRGPLKDTAGTTSPATASKSVSEPTTENHVNEPPLLLLHVGPRKTGTTTIQWFAGSHMEQFEKDNFYFVGHNPKIDSMRLHMLYKNCAKCSEEEEPECLKRWDQFESILDGHFQANHNVVASEELLSSFHDEEDAKVHLWNHLLPMLKRWRVRVVLTHRRYFEWVPSKYYQIYNPRESGSDEMRANWPDSGGRPIPSFPQYVEKVLKSKSKFPTALKQKWETRFPNQVEVYNMHNGDEFVHSFFSQMLPEATGLCQYLTNEYKGEVKNSKSSKVLHYDMLAVAAYEKGLVQKSLTRYEVSQAVEAFARDELALMSLKEFPLDCLTPEQEDELLEISLKLESEMLPEFYSSPKGEAELRSNFRQAAENNVFCSIDVDQVLSQPRWQNFLKNLTTTSMNPTP